MSKSLNVLLISFGLSLSLLMPFIGLAASALPEGEGPYLIFVSPFGEGASAVIEKAGGTAIGPIATQFAAISADVAAAELIKAGAFSVQSVAALPFLCSTEPSE